MPQATVSQSPSCSGPSPGAEIPANEKTSIALRNGASTVTASRSFSLAAMAVWMTVLFASMAAPTIALSPRSSRVTSATATASSSSYSKCPVLPTSFQTPFFHSPKRNSVVTFEGSHGPSSFSSQSASSTNSFFGFLKPDFLECVTRSSFSTSEAFL